MYVQCGYREETIYREKEREGEREREKEENDEGSHIKNLAHRHHNLLVKVCFCHTAPFILNIHHQFFYPQLPDFNSSEGERYTHIKVSKSSKFFLRLIGVLCVDIIQSNLGIIAFFQAAELAVLQNDGTATFRNLQESINKLIPQVPALLAVENAGLLIVGASTAVVLIGAFRNVVVVLHVLVAEENAVPVAEGLAGIVQDDFGWIQRTAFHRTLAGKELRSILLDDISRSSSSDRYQGGYWGHWAFSWQAHLRHKHTSLSPQKQRQP